MKEENLKLDAVMSIRVPEKTKKRFDTLSIAQKHAAYENIRVEIARAIHNAGFDPYAILEEE